MYRSGDAIARVGVVGAGTIGASWAAAFLARGLDVVVVEPSADARARIAPLIRDAWESLERAGLLTPSARLDRIEVRAALPTDEPFAVDFIQESVRETLADKQAILAAIDRVTPPDVVVASSTSGLPASQLQEACAHPARILVGHPMNPPHLIPLVEVVGGAATAPEAVDAACAVYRAIGKRPVVLRKEMVGHLATRLTVALWREAAHLVATGAASVEDVDAAVTHGLGLRLAVAGPHLSYHMGGGPGGLPAFFAWARGPLAAWCADLGAPELTPELEAALAAGVEAEANGRSVPDLATRRDAALAGLLKALAPEADGGTPRPADG